MLKVLRLLRPSPSMVVALIALAVASAGTATALPGKSKVKTDDIAKNAVRSKHIKRGNVKRADIAKKAINSSRVSPDSLTGANIDEATLGNVNVANSIAKLDYNALVVTNPPTTTPLPAPASVSCDAGLHATGGGVKLDDSGFEFTYDNYPRGTDGWEARVNNFDTVDHTFTIVVICAPAAGTS